MLTDNTRKYLLGFNGYMTKSNTCLFAAILCLIPENVYGQREMDWQLVANYFTVKSTDIFAVYMASICLGYFIVLLVLASSYLLPRNHSFPVFALGQVGLR